MNRRDSIKTLTFASIGAGLLLEGCYGISREKIKRSLTRYEYGRTPEEKIYDDKLFAQKFFSNDELFTFDKLCSIILPPNEFGSIRDAEVVQLIEFMAKDIPSYQEPLREGLIWIDNESKQRFDNLFVDCEVSQQKEILDEIAYYDPNKSIEDYPKPVQWFNLLRNLTMTGYLKHLNIRHTLLIYSKHHFHHRSYSFSTASAKGAGEFINVSVGIIPNKMIVLNM